MMRTIAAATGLAVFLCGSTLGPTSAHAQDTTFVRIGTGNQTGSWPPIGIQMANILNIHVEGVNATSLLGAGAENIKNIQNGRLEIAFSTTESQAAAVAGTAPFDGKQDKPMHLFSMYPIVAQFAVAKNSGIQSYEDLVAEPHHVNANTVGSTTHTVLKAILDTYDITYDDISEAGGVVSYVGYSDGVAQMQDGIAEMTGAIGPVPHNVILQLSENPGIELLPLEPDRAQRIADTLPGYFPTTIKAGSYTDLEDDVVTVGVGTTALVRSDMPEDLVFEIMTAIFDNIEKIQNLFPAAVQITLENGPKNSIFPLHPGARNFYESRGISLE